jgi:hypothetical protein
MIVGTDLGLYPDGALPESTEPVTAPDNSSHPVAVLRRGGT